MRKFGLIGFPLSHSFSKKHFTEKFQHEQIADCEYELYSIADIINFPVMISQNPNLRGLNVTIPHKVDIIPYLQELDDAASKIGAVNCVSIKDNDGKQFLKGYNTDAYGFSKSLKPLLKDHHTMALVLGNGGAAKAVKYVLNQLNISFIVVTRKPDVEAILYSDLTEEMLQQYTLVINTTPLGMSPNIDTAPEIPYEYFTDKHLAYDLVYNPEETLFLKKAAAKGATTKNGLEMLVLQAEQSWFIWNS